MAVITAFEGGALAFRNRPEVARTLDALDKLPLEQILALRCDEEVEPTAFEIDALLPKIEQVQSQLDAVYAACRSG